MGQVYIPTQETFPRTADVVVRVRPEAATASFEELRDELLAAGRRFLDRRARGERS